MAPSPLLPRWRDLQPLLLRSAGVVGLVATIMAVVSSDALHLSGEPAALAVVEPISPVVVPAAELRTAPDVSTPAPPETAEILLSPEPIASPPIEPELVVEPASGAAIDKPSLGESAPAEAPPHPQPTAAAEQPTGSTPIEHALPVLATQFRSDAMPAPATNEVATSASVPASADATASAPPNADVKPAAEISIAALRPSDTPDDAAADAGGFAWPDNAATCPRDWVEEQGSRADDGGADCMTTASLFASVAEDEQSALEDAAAEEATVLASLPRLPLPRPEPPADFKPSNPHKIKTVRVNSQNPSWPPEPPPNCAAGQHAKWRFVDRRAGTKEWYCR